MDVVTQELQQQELVDVILVVFQYTQFYAAIRLFTHTNITITKYIP